MEQQSHGTIMFLHIVLLYYCGVGPIIIGYDFYLFIFYLEENMYVYLHSGLFSLVLDRPVFCQYFCSFYIKCLLGSSI